jgi:hypothetical protein
MQRAAKLFFQKSLNLLLLSNDAELFRGNRQILYQIEFDHAFEEALAGGSRGERIRPSRYSFRSRVLWAVRFVCKRKATVLTHVVTLRAQRP